MQNPERYSKNLSQKQINTLILKIRTLLRNDPKNIVILYPTNVGSSHFRHAQMLASFFKNFVKVENLVSMVEFNIKKDVGLINLFIRKCYDIYQESVFFSKFIDGIASRFNQIFKFIEQSFVKDSQKRKIQFVQRIKSAKNFKKNRPSIFLSTHVSTSTVCANCIKNNYLDGALFDFIPDPYTSNHLIFMTTPIEFDNFFRIFHDQETLEKFKDLRCSKSKNLYPYGTLCSPEFLINPNRLTKKTFARPHFVIEESGTQISAYEKKVTEFIKCFKEDLENKKIYISMHLMNHKKSFYFFKNFLKKENLLNCKNLKLIFAKNLESAILSRMELIINGNISSNENVQITGSKIKFPVPVLYVAKGGHIEYRGNTLAIGLYCSGHEERNMQFGIREKRCIDLRTIPIEKWHDEVLNKLKEQINKKPVQSWALFSILHCLDKRFSFDNFLTKK